MKTPPKKDRHKSECKDAALARAAFLLQNNFMTKTYITTAIPYVNGAPHVGHTLDYLQADTYARYCKLCGDEVRFQAGTDEHGNKIFQKAVEADQNIKEYVGGNTQKFQDFIHSLEAEYTDFIRTTDDDHKKRCQAIWKKLSPHIYQDTYEGWYCEGCERFVTDKEYDENAGICPDHQTPYKKLSETNYYLKISDFKSRIKTAIETDEMQILPEFRKREILKLLEDTPDVSISRPKKNLSWGIPVPDDDSQVMYVWIDALTNYITILGYPDEDISDWWPATAQFVGKDILRFHAIIWPAILLGLDLPLPRTIVSHGFVLVDGQKMSKTIGNVVDPLEVIARHGIAACRYYFLRHVDTFLDADFTWDKFESAYNDELANDLGNLVQRLATLSSKNQITSPDFTPTFDDEYVQFMDSFHFSKAFDYVWGKIQDVNRRIDETKPWSLAKSGDREQLKKVMQSLIADLLQASYLLQPFLPFISTRITEIFTSEKIVPPKKPLFPKNET